MMNHIYSYKDKRYQVQGLGKLKDPVTREWCAAVVYIAEGKPEEVYIREIGEFYDKFKLVEMDNVPVRWVVSSGPLPLKDSCV